MEEVDSTISRQHPAWRARKSMGQLLVRLLEHPAITHCGLTASLGQICPGRKLLGHTGDSKGLANAPLRLKRAGDTLVPYRL